ncbi:MAG: ATPase [Acidimicrobiia bacterium]|nr:ATPase [Acidimicrobiia bacterium]
MNQTRVTKRPESRELIIERLVSAPRERVWVAWTEPEHIARWWGPFAWTTTVHEMEVRPGGRWRYTLAPDDGMGDTVRGLAVYDQVDAPTRLTYVDHFADSAWEPVTGSAVNTTVGLDGNNGTTKVTITTRFSRPEDLARAEQMGLVEGLGEALVRLGRFCGERESTQETKEK